MTLKRGRGLAAGTMNDPRIESERTLDFYEEACQNSELWSSCGYDGLSLVFDLPLDTVHSLPEDQKRCLMHLLTHLARPGGEEARRRLDALEELGAEDRLAGILRLGDNLAV